MTVSAAQEPGAVALTPRQFLWLGLTALTVALLLGLAFLPPFVGPEGRSLVMSAFTNVCHQLPSRSFHIGGVQVALCHRCVGIYAAIPVIVGVFVLIRRWDAVLGRHPGPAILASLVPLAADWGADFVGLWDNTPASRFLTGAVFGLVAGYFLARGVAKAAGPVASHRVGVESDPEAALLKRDR